MGRGAEILLLPLGAMAVLAVAAVFAAFFRPKLARVCAGGSVGLAGLFFLAVMPMNGWSLRWVFELSRERSPIILILFGSLLLSAVAIWAPLRRSGGTASDGGRASGRPRWWLLAGAIAVAVAGTGYGVAQWGDGRRGEEKTRALLAGDRTVRLREFRTDYQQRQVVCTDPEVLRYFEDRLRNYDSEPKHLGTTYLLTLSYEGGGTQSFGSYWTDSGDFNLFLGEPGEGGKPHGIRLTQPQPRGVKELIDYLAKPIDQVAGTVLLVEPNASRLERLP